MKDRDVGTFLDCISKGVIFVDGDQRIRMANETVKSILGTVNEYEYGHEAGIIKKNDIIILADNDIGFDDGDLCADDLRHIGLKDREIETGDILLAVGTFDNPKFECEYKHFKEKRVGDEISLTLDYRGNEISILMRFETNDFDLDVNQIIINVNGKKFTCAYNIAIGYMIVLDGETGDVKFFQSSGYTVRNESVGALLRGESFSEKTKGKCEYNIIGKRFDEIVDTLDLTKSVEIILKDKDSKVLNKANEVNHSLAIYSVFSGTCELAGETVSGAYIVIEAIDKLGEMINNHAEIIESINKRKLGAIVTTHEDYILNATGYLGSGARYREIMFLAGRAAETKANVLITGESGTGKSLLAREIHDMKQDNSPFVEVNCGAIAPSLFESELFGYVEGAFTGASRSGKMGYFEQANGGTIFLDEISELPLEMQVKLLYVIQNKIIYRVGSTKKIPIDVRIIAACNRDLAALVEEKKFRQDLFYRLNIFPINIPPLRERRSEIRKLATFFVTKFCDKYALPYKRLSEESLRKIESYNWPGNVRELENAIERAVIICDGYQIYAEHIRLGGASGNISLQERLDADEKMYIEAALIEAGGDSEKAMKSLGISKSAFYRKINKYSLESKSGSRKSGSRKSGDLDSRYRE